MHRRAGCEVEAAKEEEAGTQGSLQLGYRDFQRHTAPEFFGVREHRSARIAAVRDECLAFGEEIFAAGKVRRDKINPPALPPGRKGGQGGEKTKRRQVGLGEEDRFPVLADVALDNVRMNEGVAGEEKIFNVLSYVALDNAAEFVGMIHRDLRDFRGKGEHPRLEDGHRHRLVRREDVEGREVTCISDV